MSYAPYGIQAGDCLLYRPSTIFGWIIAIKTWTKISHLEIYDGAGESVAARDGIGVGKYPLRLDHLARVLRPKSDLNVGSADQWFLNVNGLGYDYWGLLIFALARRKGAADKMFCSEFAVNWYEAAGFKPFSNQYAADRIAPAQFLQSTEFTEVWSDGKYAAQRLTH